MPRIAKLMGPLEIGRLTAPGYYPVGGVPGLTLQITPSKSKSWLLRVKVGTKRREIGLGAYPGVGVALAREKAQQTRDAIVAGVDPVAQRAQARQNIIQQQLEEKALDWTFRRCAESYIKARAPGWRNAKHAQQWENTLGTYVYPTIGDVLVRHVGISHVTAIIEPHWTTKNETMNRVRNRIELVLDWATARRYRTGDNPARWKGNLDKLLAVRSKVAPVVGHRALDAGDLYGFMEILRGIDGMGARCLEFVILTACRSGEARLASWQEIDIDGKTWNIPGERMKSGRPHLVPLSTLAMEIISRLPRFTAHEFLFPTWQRATRTWGPLSSHGPAKSRCDYLVAAAGHEMAPWVWHDLRRTCRSNLSRLRVPSEVAEAVIAHAVPGVRGTYDRWAFLPEKAEALESWAGLAADIVDPARKIIAFRKI